MPAHWLLGEAAQIERAWIAVCREAVGPEGHVIPQQWLTHTSAPGVLASDRRRLNLIYGVRRLLTGLALCCDAPKLRTPPEWHCWRKHATYPELRLWGGQRLCVLATEVGGRWSRDARELVRQLLGPQVVGHVVGSGPACDRRDSAGRTVAAPQGGGRARTALDQVLALAEPIGPGRLPMR